jgi:hypothetical protein
VGWQRAEDGAYRHCLVRRRRGDGDAGMGKAHVFRGEENDARCIFLHGVLWNVRLLEKRGHDNRQKRGGHGFLQLKLHFRIN